MNQFERLERFAKLQKAPPIKFKDLEAAVYFCALEALQNVQNYAEAIHAMVRLADAGGELRSEISDDGKGFDPGTARKGSGRSTWGVRMEPRGGGGSLAAQTQGAHRTRAAE